LVVCCPEGEENLASTIVSLAKNARGAPVVVFGDYASLPLARAALRAGAQGFLHARMPPEHVTRALRLAEEGKVVLPKELLSAVAEESLGPDLSTLTTRQAQVLELLAEGHSNAQIAAHLYVSESTVKQHLRAAYKLLGAKNRVAAAAVFRRNKPVLRAS
jgi:DNA-binding NarL/FixJ family response regulator